MNDEKLTNDSYSKSVIQVADQFWERFGKRMNCQVWGRVTKAVWSQLDEQVAVQVRRATTQVQWQLAIQMSKRLNLKQ
jgi:hypothetical protein